MHRSRRSRLQTQTCLSESSSTSRKLLGVASRSFCFQLKNKQNDKPVLTNVTVWMSHTLVSCTCIHASPDTGQPRYATCSLIKLSIIPGQLRQRCPNTPFLVGTNLPVARNSRTNLPQKKISDILHYKYEAMYAFISQPLSFFFLVPPSAFLSSQDQHVLASYFDHLCLSVCFFFSDIIFSLRANIFHPQATIHGQSGHGLHRLTEKLSTFL